MSDNELPEIGLAPSVEAQVDRLAALAWSAGCQGVVASVGEAAFLRERMPAGALIVCPGIQLPEAGTTDQVRTAIPAAAVRAGATHIVVGRAIASADDPLDAFRKIAGNLLDDA